MDERNGVKTFHASSRTAWRQWLRKNHAKEKSLWLIVYHKKSKTPSVYYDEAVEEALCFGWIDSKPNKRDDESFYLFFAKRNPKSKWSALNKKRVATLLKAGLIEKAGLAMIELAKQNGTWNALDAVENLEMPEGLKQAFSKNKKALGHFQNFPPSVKKGIFQWIADAKREETKTKRITETVTLAAQNIRANQWRK